MAEVLVVVDMQTNYSAAMREGLRRSIEVEAMAVLGRGGKVVAIMYDGAGDSTVNLPHETPVLWKDTDDGGRIVHGWLLGAGLIDSSLRVRFCGVNTCACVYKTASTCAASLHSDDALNGDVEIALALCGDDCRGKVEFNADGLPRVCDR